MKYLLITSIMFISLIANEAYANHFNFVVRNQDIVNVIEKRVQINADTFLGLDGYYAIGDTIDAEKQGEYTDKLAELEAKVNQFEAKIDILISILSGKTPTPTPAPADNTPPTDDGTTEPAEPVEPKGLEGEVYKLLRANCYSCHKTDGNGLRLFTEDGKSLATLSLNDVVNIHHRTEGIVLHDGETLMPKGKQPLSADEMKLIKRWMFEKAIQGE